MCRHGGRMLGMLGVFICAVVIALPGCSLITPTKSGSPFAPTHPLTKDAKNLRLANLGNLQLPRELDKQPLPTYTVEPGDVLLVQPLELDSPVRLPGDQPVLPDGTINLGKYGQLMVYGRTVTEIEKLVHEAVAAKTKEPGYIMVRLVSRQSKVYYVLGEVNAPGAFQLNGRETVLDAILAAGGLTDQASPNNIVLSRPSRPDECRVVLPICYKSIVQLADTTTNYQLTAGDRIFVPSKSMGESLFGEHCEKAPCHGFHAPCVLPRNPLPLEGHHVEPHHHGPVLTDPSPPLPGPPIKFAPQSRSNSSVQQPLFRAVSASQ